MTDFQSRSSAVGRAYEDRCVSWLLSQGFTIVGRNIRHASGVQFDIHATDPFGIEVGIECKASDESALEAQRGMRRSDNRWKVMGYLYVLRVWRQQGRPAPRYMLITSHMPAPDTPPRLSLDLAVAIGDLTIIELPFEGPS